VALAFDDRWLWDFWIARDGPDYHAFYLQAPTSLGDPDRRHWHVSIGHAVSTDLRTWEVLPDALAPAERGRWDDCTTWTGSVLRHAGRWWMFYTGTSHAEQGRVQRVGSAVSDDLVTWERTSDRPAIEADPAWYELLDPDVWYEQAWRDPWVYADPATGLFHALVTARANDGDPATRGVVGHATSWDLAHWLVHPPVTEPGVFGHLEIPQLVQVDGYAHLLFASPPGPASVQAAHPGAAAHGTHVLTAADPLGPYDWGTHRVLDGDATGTRYGGKLVDGPDGWVLLTWRQFDEDGCFVGRLDDPVPVRVDGGTVTVAS
jgi:beta-fructofuranosidase